MTLHKRLRAAWAALMGTTAVVAPAPEPERRGMAIDPTAVALAGGERERRIHTDDPAVIFAQARVAPGVVPAAIAMDYGLPACPSSVSNITSWAISSAFHEGQYWPGYTYLAELMQRAEYRRGPEIWAEHATRKFVELKGPQEKIDKLNEMMKALGVRDVFRKWSILDKGMGRGQVFLDFDNFDRPRELETRLAIDPRKISTKNPLKRLKLVEPMWSYPAPYNSTNPLAPGFYEPSGWYVFGRTVHASRLLTMVSNPVPDMLKPAYAFGGISDSQLAKPYIDNWLRTRQSVSDMINNFSHTVLATDLDSAMAGGDGGATLKSRVAFMVKYQTNNGIKVIDKDRENILNVAAPLGGLAELQMQALEQTAAVCRIPLSIYIQQSPSGLNANSEGEIETFYADVKAYQEENYTAPFQTLLEIMQLSLFDAIDPEITFTFPPLWEMSAKEAAEIEKSEADTGKVYIDAGVISPDEERERLREKDTGGYRNVNLSGDAPELETEEDDTGNNPKDDKS